MPNPTTPAVRPAHRPTLVLGATGKTGRRVAERLGALGRPVRAGSRAATPRFDWDDPATWPAALDGAGAVYVAYQPDLAMPRAAETVGAFAAAAASAGVARLVLLAGRGEPLAERAERALQAAADRAAVAWTVVRASWFAQNFSESFLQPMVAAGEIALPVGAVAEPFVDAEDIADVAVSALVDAGHAGRTYDVTGAELLTFADAAAALGAALGRPVHHTRLTSGEFVAGMRGAGVPAAEAEMLAALFAEVLDGRNAHVGDGVRQALGRAPRSFATFAREAAAAGAWTPAACPGLVAAP
jgi:uncharacterized protein YbjT (DUF2867 family)